MKKKSIMALLTVLFTACVAMVSCSNEDEYDSSAISVISLSDAQKGLYPQELIKKDNLPTWIQQWIDSENAFPHAYVLKAKNKNKIVYVLSSLSSSSPLDYRNEDGSEWHGAFDGFYDVKIIYYKL